jgi:hypothetical protein
MMPPSTGSPYLEKRLFTGFFVFNHRKGIMRSDALVTVPHNATCNRVFSNGVSTGAVAGFSKTGVRIMGKDLKQVFPGDDRVVFPGACRVRQCRINQFT